MRPRQSPAGLRVQQSREAALCYMGIRKGGEGRVAISTKLLTPPPVITSARTTHPVKHMTYR